MPRLPRYTLPDQPHHVIQRGNNRAAMFVAPADYALFREFVADACDRFECAIHAYVFMTNHVHFLLTPFRVGAIGRMMQSVGRNYVAHFNSTYRRTGALWEGRYRATPIESERYLLVCHRYIELNPVRACMTKRPDEYRWSSYRANAVGRSDSLVTSHVLYDALGNESTNRQRAYRQLFAKSLTQDTLTAIRAATNKGWALGSAEFCEALARRGRRPSPLRKCRTPRPGSGV